MDVVKTRKDHEIYAYCCDKGCLWRANAITVQSAAAHAAKHARNRGHKTGVEFWTRIEYKPKEYSDGTSSAHIQD